MQRGEVYRVEGDDTDWLVVDVKRHEQVVSARVIAFAFREQIWKSYNGSGRYLRSCPDGLTRDFIPTRICEVPL
jgi:hypothetical protein